MTGRRLLDLFAGAGGCSVGYHRAGFDVTGVDREPHPDYPFTLRVADALEVLADPAQLTRFDVIHASPPCQGYTTMSNRHRGQGGRTDDHDRRAADGHAAQVRTEALAPILALHRRRPFEVTDFIPHGARPEHFTDRCDHCRVTWPCDTIRAIPGGAA